MTSRRPSVGLENDGHGRIDDGSNSAVAVRVLLHPHPDFKGVGSGWTYAAAAVRHAPLTSFVTPTWIDESILFIPVSVHSARNQSPSTLRLLPPSLSLSHAPRRGGSQRNLSLSLSLSTLTRTKCSAVLGVWEGDEESPRRTGGEVRCGQSMETEPHGRRPTAACFTACA
ncbi:hypothetical protein PVAP13_1KG009201 [Panicum virgatum]|uniref:Uncharacterized protein n=1 Tax=Panicum virgatum TaxID=38727 RepID=A0A8T0X1H7_PANVG|nr:hypothetical protein PVAP13_1KG009201 [Panicum virgatum]